jgi:hypothetical protein
MCRFLNQAARVPVQPSRCHDPQISGTAGPGGRVSQSYHTAVGRDKFGIGPILQLHLLCIAPALPHTIEGLAYQGFVEIVTTGTAKLFQHTQMTDRLLPSVSSFGERNLRPFGIFLLRSIEIRPLVRRDQSRMRVM